MTLFPFFIYVTIGLFAGFFSGLLGIGGGIVSVPALFLTFTYLGFPKEYVMQMAIGTSLGAMVITAASSAWSHHMQKGIFRKYLISLAPGIIFGAILGAVIADYLSSKALSLIFGICLSAIGVYFLFPHVEENENDGSHSPSFLLLSLIGIAIGTLSTILGIGGGIMTVPILTHFFHIPLRNAISTSAATGFLIALAGAVSFLSLGLNHEGIEGNMGYLNLPAFLCIGIISSFTAPYGAHLAYTLPIMTLRRVFGIMMIVVGLWMA